MKPFRSTLMLVIALACAQGVFAEGGGPPESFDKATCFDVVSTGAAVHVLFGQPVGADAALRFFHTRSDDGGSSWSLPVEVTSSHGPPGRHHRGNDPQLAVHGDKLMALWTAQGGGPFGSGPLATALSDDGGKTWRPGPAPTPEKGAGYRFPAIAADAKGFQAIWIHALGAERSLRHARLAYDAESTWSEPGVIDENICACCWNRLKVGTDGSLVAFYRDKEPSDMALAISTDDGATWRRTGTVGAFGWNFFGCPHVGGGLADTRDADGKVRWIASVWTGETQSVGAYVLLGDASGSGWSPPVRLGESPSGGRNTDVASGSGGRVALVWDEIDNGQMAARIAHSKDAGRTWSAPFRLSAEKSNATHPRVVPSGDGFVALWTEIDADGAPRMARRFVVGIDVPAAETRVGLTME